MPKGKTLLISAIIIIIAAALIVGAQNRPLGSGKETTRQTLKSNASKEETPNPSPTLDRPISISYSEIFKYGSTSWSSVALNSMKNLPPLPTGYEPFDNLAYKLETEAVVSGFNITTFQVPSIREQSSFDKLSVLHIEFDELSPYKWAWVDSTVRPFRWSGEYYVAISKASYDQASPDFASKKISAIHPGLGIFVLAQYSPLPSPGVQPFTLMETSTTGFPARVKVGDNVTYTITVKNRGPKTARDVNLQNGLDIDIDFVSATSSQGTCIHSDLSDDRTICHLGALQVGANATITIIGKVRYNVAMDTGPRNRPNNTYLVFKERPTDTANYLNTARIEIYTRSVPRYSRLN